MSGANETAYPQLAGEITENELISSFTLTTDEKRFLAGAYSRTATQMLLAIQLKVLQRLGYFIALTDVPETIVRHICKTYRANVFSKVTLEKYDQSGSKSIHQRALRTFSGIRVLDEAGRIWLDNEAKNAAHTKQELPDIINILLEELVHHRYELPGFVTLSRLASRARSHVNDKLYRKVASVLSEDQRMRIDQMIHRQETICAEPCFVCSLPHTVRNRLAKHFV